MQKEVAITASTVCAILMTVFQSRALSEVGVDQKTQRGDEKMRLIESAVRPWRNVNRLTIEYEAVPSLRNTDLVPVHRILTVSTQDYHHFSAHFPFGVHPWQSDPFAQETYIHKGQVTRRWPFNRAYSEATMKPGDVMGGSTWMDVLWPIVPHWPLVEYKMPLNPQFGTPLTAIDALSSSQCRLLQETEDVAGEKCSVFDCSGVDRIWIATNKGLCVMRRDYRDPDSRKLLQRILTTKVEQVLPGAWLPTQFSIRFFRLEKGTNDPAFEKENNIRLLRWAFNDDVPLESFIPVHRPGSLKTADRHPARQVLPGGEDLLSDIVTFLHKYLELPAKSIPHHRTALWLLGGAALGCIAGIFIFTGKRIEKPQLTSVSCVTNLEYPQNTRSL